jgi:glycosyltransferase involved in cell wall biosynthesis
MLRLAFFDFVTHYGGAQRSTVELGKRLSGNAEIHFIDAYGCCQPYQQAVRDTGCQSHILCADSKKTTVGGTDSLIKRFINVIASLPNLLKVRSQLVKAVKQIRPEVVCVNSHKALHLIWAASCRYNMPVVFYLRGNYLPEQISTTTRYLFRHFVRRFIAVSTVTKKNICKLKIDSARIDVIFNPIDIEEVARKNQQPLKEQLPGPGAKMRILLPGTLVPGKGQLCAIRALKILIENNHDAVLWMAGDTPDGRTGEYQETMQTEINRLNLSNRAFVLGWREDALAVMSRATIVILPSHSEGMPRTLLEAMASGKPIVTTPVGGIPDLIIDGQTGLLADIDDEEGFALAMERFMDEDFAQTITSNAMQHIKQNCNPPGQRDQVLEVLRKTGTNLT